MKVVKSMKYDVIIIGAGVTGSAVAREVSRQNRSVLVLEKNADVCEGSSKANSGIVHGGYDAKPGTMKAKMNVRGNELMEETCRTLDVPFKRNESLVLAFSQEDVDGLRELLARGEENGVPGLSIIYRDELLELEPNLSDKAYAALRVPTGGIVCPFELTMGFAENAAMNGVEFHLAEPVTAIAPAADGQEGYQVTTTKDTYEAKIVINAAGVYADKIHAMVSKVPMSITARRGEYCLCDKSVGNLVSRTIFQLPGKLGKGVLVTPTAHGNILIGPNAEDIEDKEGTCTTAEGLAEILAKAADSVKTVPSRQVITSFAGLRAHEAGGDFIIREAEDAKNFIDVAGIESPGLTSAPAIGEYVAGLLQEMDPVSLKENFIAERKRVLQISGMSAEEKAAMIRENPAFANVICRCETVTEGEILAAIHRPLGATMLDGVKRRTRAGMGRCGAGFCSTRVVAILARELGISPEEVTKFGGDSKILVSEGEEVSAE